MRGSPTTLKGFLLYLLSIDPGVQTGVALLTGEGGIVWTVTAEGPDYPELKSALSQYPDAEVVMEDAPDTRHYQEPFRKVLVIVEEAGRKPVLIRPSQWKNHPASRVSDQESSGFETKHEGEAVGIGRWHLSQRRDDGQEQSAGSDPAGAHSQRS